MVVVVVRDARQRERESDLSKYCMRDSEVYFSCLCEGRGTDSGVRDRSVNYRVKIRYEEG